MNDQESQYDFTDNDSRTRRRDYQQLLGEDFFGVMLNSPSVPLFKLLTEPDIIRAHGLGVQITMSVDV